MIVELHLLQNFGPSNLNRDDTGTPKNAEFGGHRRARISSQCQKRAIRTMFPEYLQELGLSPDDLAERTQLVVKACTDRLVAAGKEEEQARTVVSALLGGAKLKLKDNKTEYLLFLGRREIAALCELALQHWDELAAIVASADAAPSGRRGAKKEAAALIPASIQKALNERMDAGKAIDLALFGRMVADLAEINRDAACQVAHAISTNRVNIEFDYFTAVDSLRPKQEPGAGMIGTVEFNSACYYRYVSVDMQQLTDNLQGDVGHAHKALQALIRAMIEAVPTGKQNSFAAHNPPSFIAAVVRDAGQWNLINAFAKPINPKSEQNLIELSITALDEYWGRLTTMYGTKRLRGVWTVSNEIVAMPRLAPSANTTGNGDGAMQEQSTVALGEQLSGVDELIARVIAVVQRPYAAAGSAA